MKLKFECDLVPVGTPTVNGNVYSREVLERVRDQINTRDARHLVMNKPADPVIPPSIIEAVGVVDEAEVTDSDLVVRGVLIDEKLIEFVHASDISIKAVGYGSLDGEMVSDDYKFDCATVLPADDDHPTNVRWEPCESD